LPSTTTRRLGLTTGVAVLAASVLAGAGAAATAAPASATRGTDADVKTRAVDALASTGRRADHSGVLAPSAASLRATRATKPVGTQVDRSAPQTVAADATDCTTLALAVTPTRDHNVVHWSSTGAGSYTVWRQRYDGAWRTIGSTAGTSFVDRVNTDAFVTYRVVTATMTCDLGHWESMTNDDVDVDDDGYGWADAVYGGASTDGVGTGTLMEQDLYSQAVPTGGSGTEPAFTPDGRRVVVTVQGADSAWSLQVRDPAHPEQGTVSTLAVPTGFLATESAWSPDSRSIAYTRYAVDDQGAVSNPQLRIWTPATGAERAVTGGADLIQPDWRSATVLVAAGWQPGEGLFTLPVAGGTRYAVTGTANAGYPEMGPDGTLWWVEGVVGSSSLRYLPPGGSAQTWESSSASRFERPRTTPSNDVYVMQIDLNVVDDPDDNTFVVKDVHTGQGVAIGAALDQSLVGFGGYDVRQPLSKGTSDLAGDAGGDILARDAAGVLWAFPSSSAAFVEPRVKVGTGWNTYGSFVAAGDLNGDNHGDVVAKDKNGALWFYAGRGKGRLAPRALIGTGWGSLSYLAPGDLSGDGRADLVSVTSGGTLTLHVGNGTGTGFTAKALGSGFAGSTVMGVGDFNYDSTADLVSRDKGTGRLHLSAGLGGGKFAARKYLATGWGSFTGFGTPEFPSATGVYARTSTGAMRFYQSIGDGRLAPGYASVPGSWSGYAFTS
jgi:hypothetical protein